MSRRCGLHDRGIGPDGVGVSRHRQVRNFARAWRHRLRNPRREEVHHHHRSGRDLPFRRSAGRDVEHRCRDDRLRQDDPPGGCATWRCRLFLGSQASHAGRITGKPQTKDSGLRFRAPDTRAILRHRQRLGRADAAGRCSPRPVSSRRISPWRISRRWTGRNAISAERHSASGSCGKRTAAAG